MLLTAFMVIAWFWQATALTKFIPLPDKGSI
jgi:hypothetical protein